MQGSPEEANNEIVRLKMKLSGVEEDCKKEIKTLKEFKWSNIKELGELASLVNYKKPNSKSPQDTTYMNGLRSACTGRSEALSTEESVSKLIKERQDRISSDIEYQMKLLDGIKDLNVVSLPCFKKLQNPLHQELLEKLGPLVAHDGVDKACKTLKDKLTGAKEGDYFSILGKIGKCQLWDTDSETSQLAPDEAETLEKLKAAVPREIIGKSADFAKKLKDQDGMAELKSDELGQCYLQIVELYNKIDARKRESTAALASLKKTLDSWSKALGEVLKKKQGDYDETVKQSHEAQAARTITNFAGETRTIGQACIVSAADGNFVGNNQLGACAAPKLFAEAMRRGLVPVALSEFWFGRDESSRKSGVFYDSCQYCRSILGFMLHGLKESQEKLATSLQPAQDEVKI
jgi:hypothetical protein